MYVRGYLQGSENGRVVTIEQNLCPNVSLNNQREITLILKRDKRKSISAEVNKKTF